MRIEFACCTDSGGKSQNQDNFLVIDKLFSLDYILFAVFDGHGSKGAECAAFVKENLSKYFTNVQHLLVDPSGFLSQVFKALAKELSGSEIDTFISGTTLTVAIIDKHDMILYMAHVGDCRIVMGRYETKKLLHAVELTPDHTCFEPEELERVLQCGARVQQDSLDGPLRIFKGSLPYPGIVVTRTLGDDSARCLGVINQPSVGIYKLTRADLFMVLATDGVWDGLTNMQVLQIIACLSDKPVQTISEHLTRASLEALEKERVDDNTTNIVIKLQWGTSVTAHSRKRRGTWSSFSDE